LPPIAAHQQHISKLTHCNRGQAPSHIGYAACPDRKGARLNSPRRTRHLLVQIQLTLLSERTACGSKKLGGAMPGMYWSDTNMRQRSANADTTRDSWVLLAVA